MQYFALKHTWKQKCYGVRSLNVKHEVEDRSPKTSREFEEQESVMISYYKTGEIGIVYETTI
jgi:hypothetical protein